MPERRFALVRMELIGEPTITPDGQSIQHARFPWQRPGDASHGISLTDIVRVEMTPEERHTDMMRRFPRTMAYLAEH